MKKLGVLFKEASESRIKKNIKDSGNFFIIKYSGLSGPELNTLRLSLRDAKSELFVVKNTIARRALKDSGKEDLTKMVDGPCGFVFAAEPVGVSKVLFNFAKDHNDLKLEGGVLNEGVIDSSQIASLAKLPSREVLLGQAVGAMKSPITGFVMVLKGNLRKLVFALEQIRSKKPA
ncbi:MAG: 50S ribosomal protein L10 [Deltaproteobacteria bacterium]